MTVNSENPTVTVEYVEDVEAPSFPQGEGLDLGGLEPSDERQEIESELEAAPKEEKKEEPAQDYSRQFHAINKKERELRQQQMALQAQQQEYQQYQQIRELAKTQPLKFLEANGLSVERIIGSALGEDEEPPMTQLEKRLAATEAQIRGYQEQELQFQQKQKQQELERQRLAFVDEGVSYVNQNSDRYELIKANKAEAEVASLMEKTFLETGGKIRLTHTQAADLIEKQLEAESELQIEQLENLRKIKKLQKKFGPGAGKLAPALDSAKVETIPVGRTIRTQTLTNNAVQAGVPGEQLTGDALDRHAKSLIRWTDD